MKGCDRYGMNILLYLDKELAGQDLEEFYGHLKECTACRVELESEEALSGLLHRSRPLYSAPDALRKRIILGSELLPSTATDAPVYFRWHTEAVLARLLRFAKLPSWPALITAILLVAVGLLFVPALLLQSRANRYVETAIAAHRSFVSGSLPLEIQSESPSVVTAWFAGRVPFSFRLPNSAEESVRGQPYRLVGGRLVNYQGGYAALVAYQVHERKISLLVSSTRFAAAAGGEEVNSGGIIFHHRKQESFNVITWSTHGLTYALVSSLPGSGKESCLVCHQSMADGSRFSAQQ